MLRRRTISLAILSAAFALALHGASAPARAASIVSEMMVNGVDTIVPNGTAGSTKYAYYQIINPRSTTVGTGGAAINDLIVSTVSPTDAIQPTSGPISPLSIVSGSFGFDPKNLQVFIKPTDATGPEALALFFGNGGLASQGTLDFKVSLDSSYSTLTAPTLTLRAPFADLSATAPQLMAYTPTVAGGAPTPTPEPIPLALWSVLAGAGLLRARAFRRSRRSTLALPKNL